MYAFSPEGVATNISIDDRPDYVRRVIDPQLEKAIEVIKENLETRLVSTKESVKLDSKIDILEITTKLLP